MSPAAGAPRGGRVDALDAIRLLAAIQMIQGHTIDALLADSLRSGPFFDAWTWLRGLTAPIFLISAGLSFSLAASLAGASDFLVRKAGRARTRRMLRSVALVVTGTLMHLGDDPLRIDVLQCVGLALLALDAFVGISRSPRSVFGLSATFAVALVLLAAPLDGLEGEGWVRIPLAFLGHATHSLFPLLPWAGYVFGGAALARVLLPQGGHTPAKTLSLRCLAVAVMGLVLAQAVALVLPEHTVQYSSRASVVLLRAACVLALMGGLALLFWRIPLPTRLRWLAGETLALYVFHLLFLYAAVVGPAHVIGHALTGLNAALASLAMIALSIGVARLWAWLWPFIEARVFPPERRAPVR